MDFMKILQRSWHILWHYRALWIFGILVALTVGGTNGGGNPTVQFSPPAGQSIQNGDWFNGYQWDGSYWDEASWSVLSLVIALACFFCVVGVVFTILRYVANISLIRMVDQYEETEKYCTVKQGFRLGWSKASWRIFLIDLVIFIPLTIIAIVLLAITFSPLLLWITGETVPGIIGSIMAAGMFLIYILIMILVSTALHIVTRFFYRAAALQDLGVFASIREGFLLFRKNLWNSVLMWLILLGVQIAYGLAAMILGIIFFVIFMPLGIIPGLIAAGLSSLIAGGPIAMILGLIVAVFFIFLLISLPLLFFGGLKEVFLSTAWTLTYRHFKGSKETAAIVEPPSDNEGIEEIPSGEKTSQDTPQDDELV
jgi:hypothetical protein